jgi:AcrR family transcriptional regulator
VPTGIAIHDPRQQLFDAAERILLRDGPNALTSRAVTTEAGFAKGVLHRHFADFDAFLAELVADRIARIEHQAAALRDSAGTGTVAGNLTGALTDLFGSVAVAIVALVISRDNLRARLRQATPDGRAPVRQATPDGRARVRQARPGGVPLLAEATAMMASYLAIERDLGRIAADTDVDTLAPMLIGAGHLLFAARDGAPPEPAAVAKVVAAAIASVVPEPPSYTPP